jgi:Cu+-exporting ATPase
MNQTASETSMMIPVTGMTCGACAARIEKALSRADGITSANVNFATEKADIHWDPAKLDSQAVSGLITGAGFGVGEDKFSFAIEGMTCSACATRIEKVLNRIPGVIEASVNFALEKASVTTLTGSITPELIAAQINNTGYKAQLQTDATVAGEDAQRSHAEKKLADELRALKISIALTVPLVLQMVLQVFGFQDAHFGPELEVVLATPVQFIIGARFYKAAWNALRGGSANMDVLVVLGTTSAYLYSWYLIAILGTEATGELYFEASAVIITLVLLGKYLESKAKRSTTEAIRQLMDLRPEIATVLRNGQEVTLAINEVVSGDLVIVKPGSNIPVDGIVSEGSSDVDESLITGESIPVLKTPGDKMTGGAVNGTGRLIIEATAVGLDSTLAKIIQLVENAQVGKAPVQRLVDRISEIFVPVVIVIAALTFGFTFWSTGDAGNGLIVAVSVLVIACPCALGLATPTAIMTGTGAAARAGILIRDVESLERAHQLDAIIFDKTGTLTEGRPEVTRTEAFTGNEDELIMLAASVQQGSEHPLAEAIMRLAETRQITAVALDEFMSHTGSGVSGLIEGKTIRIGRRGFVAESGADLAQGDALAVTLEQQGQTAIWLTRNDQLIGLFGIADKLRESSPAAIRELRNMGVKTILLSGDADTVAQLIGKEAGLDESRGGVLPDQKAAEVVSLTAQGFHVGMIGDGINDAPALAAAHVGIAMGTGTDIAMETASVTLMRSDPRLVPAAISISRATWNKIWQNLFWAFIYNVIGIPLAALGYLSPTLAGATMAMSSVSVVSNSLLLKRWKP